MKKIGKWYQLQNILYVLAGIATGLVRAHEMQLRITSMQGEPIQHIAAGKLCVIEVTDLGNDTVARPEIGGLDASWVMQVQDASHAYVINSTVRNERRFRWIVRFAKPGIVKLGPVRFATQQGVRSADIFANISVEPAVEQNNSVQSLEWKLGQEEYFIGQRIPFRIRFYYTNDTVSRVGLHSFTIDDSKFTMHPETYRGVEQRNGATSHYVEWRGSFIPQKAGKFILPQVGCEYVEAQSEHQSSSWGSLFSMMGMGLSQCRIYAKEQTVAIKPLPSCSDHICGVGRFTDIHTELSGKQAELGEPLTYTLTLTGDIDRENLTAPLITLPEGLKAYPSHIEQQGNKIVCEYIIQGVKSGPWHIPAQQITCFDPVKKEYMRFTTDSFDVRIEEAGAGEDDQDTLCDAVEETEGRSSETESSHIIAQPAASRVWHRQLPWWVFVVFVILPVLGLAIKTYGRNYITAWRRYYGHKRIFEKYLQELKQAVFREDIAAVWAIARIIVHEITLCQEIEPTSSCVMDYLISIGMSEHERVIWLQCWNELTEALFARHAMPGGLQRVVYLMEMLELHVMKKSWYQ